MLVQKPCLLISPICCLKWIACGHNVLVSFLLLVTFLAGAARAEDTCADGVPGCTDAHVSSGNSLLQKVSMKSRVHFDAIDEANVSATSAQPLPYRHKATHHNNKNHVRTPQPPILLEKSGKTEHSAASGVEAKRDAAGKVADQAATQGWLEAKGQEIERSTAGGHKWAPALLFVRMMGRQLHGRLFAAAGTYAGTASGYAIVSISALLCVIVLTAYLFMQAPGNHHEKGFEDGEVHHSPHHGIARPRAIDTRQGGLPRIFKPHSSRSPPPTSGVVAGSSRSPPPTSGRFPQSGHYMPPGSHNHLSRGQATALQMPFSPGVTPVSTGMSLPMGPRIERESPMSTQRNLAPTAPTTYPMNLVASKSLCPGLVVPTNSECVLTLRALTDLSPRASNNSALSPPYMSMPTAPQRLDILDLQGKPVMRAQVVNPWPRDAGFKQRAPVVTLCTTDPSGREEKLTFCRAGGEGGGRRSMYIYDKDDVLFGCIKRDVTRPRYVLTSSRGGLQLLFEGDFLQHNITVLSDSRDIQSHCEPTRMHGDASHYYQVRVAAEADVGLIISGLLSIDAMESM